MICFRFSAAAPYQGTANCCFTMNKRTIQIKAYNDMKALLIKIWCDATNKVKVPKSVIEGAQKVNKSVTLPVFRNVNDSEEHFLEKSLQDL